VTDPRHSNRRQGQNEEGRSSRRKGAAYQGAFEAALAILIAGFAGKFADDHFGTAPRYLLIGFFIGFCSFVLRLVRLGRYLQATAEEDSDSQ
jgi:F0F1-type ATP synthase assembly protein I